MTHASTDLTAHTIVLPHPTPISQHRSYSPHLTLHTTPTPPDRPQPTLTNHSPHLHTQPTSPPITSLSGPCSYGYLGHLGLIVMANGQMIIRVLLFCGVAYSMTVAYREVKDLWSRMLLKWGEVVLDAQRHD